MKKMLGTMLSVCTLLLGAVLFSAGESQAASVTLTGAAVMILELLGMRIIGPVDGVSFYV